MNYTNSVNIQEILSEILTGDTPFDTPNCLCLEVFQKVTDTPSDTLARTYKDVRTPVNELLYIIYYKKKNLKKEKAVL